MNATKLATETKSVYIGIDIGTTYIKAGAFSENGHCLSDCRTPTVFPNPSDFDPSKNINDIFEKVDALLLKTVSALRLKHRCPITLCIAGISPVLLAIDPKNNRSLALPYWRVPRIDQKLTGWERTKNRIIALLLEAERRCFSTILICDLIGYIVFRFTNTLCLNTITAAELGLQQRRDKIYLGDSETMCMPSIVPPAKVSGRTSVKTNSREIDVEVVAGAPDSFCTAIGSGCTDPEDLLIYLGTFGSLLEVENDLLSIVHSPDIPPKLPYVWRVSSPGFGRFIEKSANCFFPNETLVSALALVDRLVLSALPSNGEHIVQLPVWDELGLRVGRRGLKRSRRRPLLTRSILARSVFESLGYLLLAKGYERIESGKDIYVAGGGAKSDVLVESLSEVLQERLYRSEKSRQGGSGAALISAAASSLDSPMKMGANELSEFNGTRSSPAKFKMRLMRANGCYKTDG